MPEDLVLLADDVFTNYFPDAKSKNVLVDASLLLNNDWHSIATDVWQTPKEIFDKLVSNNLTFDCLHGFAVKDMLQPVSIIPSAPIQTMQVYCYSPTRLRKLFL